MTQRVFLCKAKTTMYATSGKKRKTDRGDNEEEGDWGFKKG